MSSTPMMLAIGSVRRRRTRLGVRCRSHAASSDSTGNIGRMYDGSFDPEALKNRKMKAVHTTPKRCHEKPFAAGLPSRHIESEPQVNNGSQGSAPITKSGTKYHHDCSRLCVVV